MTHSAPTAPFFIVGSPRSGTTLVRFIVGTHSRLWVPDETGFVPFLRTPVYATLDRTEVQMVLERIGHLNRFWKGMVDDIDVFFDQLPEPRLNHILDALYRQHIAKHDAVRWGDKTPLYVQYVPYISRLFPDAQFIHVIRDGRDATLSAMQKWGWDKPYIDPYYLLKNWRRNVHAGQAARSLVGSDRYLEVRYETLVNDTEASAQEICAFLGESFERGMLDQTRLAAVIGGGIDGHTEVQKPISAGRCGRWVSEMSTFEKRLADHLVGSTLTSLGYPLAALGALTPSERVRMWYLAGKFRVNDTLRTALYKTELLTLNRNRKSKR